jgi:feruloyl esterase
MLEIRRSSVFAALALAAALPAGRAMATGRSCDQLTAQGLLPGARVAGAVMRPADAKIGLPAFCEVTATLSPVPGSRIGVVFRLPAAWNGKLLGLGGGGWAGNLRLEAAAEGLRQGYATAQTDTGHVSADPTDLAWALAAPGVLNAAAADDFAFRAVHQMTVSGKQAVALYYGRTIDKAYFQGCSTGGRQGLIEAQRFPDDYDGIVAGAPVYDFLVQTSALFRTQFFHADPDANLMAAQAGLVNQAVLDACDQADGLKDGIVTDPRACRWDPAALQCKAGQQPPQCLTVKQVATVRSLYAGLKTPDGAVAAWPLMRGGELDWVGRSIGTPRAPLGSNATTGARAIPYLIYRDPDLDIMFLTPQALLKAVAASPYKRVYEAADPDLRAFAARGGKLILWHGLNDPGPSPLGTIKYYSAARKALGRAGGGAAAMTLFLAPGIYHCGGGPGPDRFDMLTPLDAWVAHAAPPQRIPAVNAASGLTRPLCAYPGLPFYDGRGDPNALASFVCRASRRADAGAIRSP